jgi:hypothetical protein
MSGLMPREDFDRIVDGLATIRDRRSTSFFMLLGWLPFIVLVAFPLAAVLKRESIVFYLAGAYVAVLFSVHIRVMSSRCPRCSKRFHNGPWGWHPWTSKCLNCGQPLAPARVDA